MKVVVVIFPGSNRERDLCAALSLVTGHEPIRVWHRDASLPDPDLIVLPSWIIVLCAQIALFPERTLEWVGASLGASLFLFIALLAYPRGMGMGDVKLALLLGAALGKAVSVGLMVGMLAALAFSLVLFAQHGMRARKMAIPFGPFLAFGALVALFAGDQVLSAYLGLF